MGTRLIVNGAGGRMGRRIVALAAESGDFDLVAALERPDHPDLGKDAGQLAGVGPLSVALSERLDAAADVMIDFTLPEATDRTIALCRERGIRLILGTTGLREEQKQALRNASAEIAVVYGTNMSVGMNVLFYLVAEAAQMLGPEYDIEIVEAHHRFKKDAPSGSALSLAESIARATDRKWPDCLIHGRQGREALRERGTIGMHAIRAGDIVGQHSVMYSTLGETIKIEHDAHTRDNFVRGALRAAKWIVDQQPGLYAMADVLGLKR